MVGSGNLRPTEEDGNTYYVSITKLARSPSSVWGDFARGKLLETCSSNSICFSERLCSVYCISGIGLYWFMIEVSKSCGGKRKKKGKRTSSSWWLDWMPPIRLIEASHQPVECLRKTHRSRPRCYSSRRFAARERRTAWCKGWCASLPTPVAKWSRIQIIDRLLWNIRSRKWPLTPKCELYIWLKAVAQSPCDLHNHLPRVKKTTRVTL